MNATAVVTGAAGGIGLATVRRLAAEGVRVIATDVRESAEMPETVEYLQLDLLAPESPSRLFQSVGSGGLDYLVNAAGIALFDDDGSLYDIDDDVWDRTLGVNLHALRKVLVEALPHLHAGRGRSIVNVASTAGIRGMDSPLDAYAVSKAAVVSLTRSIALQLGPEQIRCNSVCPGAVLTPMIDYLYTRSPDRRADMESRTPLRRIGSADEIASAIWFLLSSDASFITAADLVVDGGWTAQIK